MKFRYLYIFSISTAAVIMVFVLLRPPEIDGSFEGSYVRACGRVSKIEENTSGTYFYISDITSFGNTDCSASAADVPKKIIFITEDTSLKNKIKRGYFVCVAGKYSLFDKATNEGEFDSRVYYRTLGVEGKIENGVVNDYCRGSVLDEKLYESKQWIGSRIDELYQDEAGGILKALLIGDKSKLPDETKEAFKQAGISHILSVSSMHITILGMAVFGFLVRLNCPHKVSAFLSGISMILFCIAIDGSVSARRAVFMFICRMAAIMLGRTYDSRTSLGVSALTRLISEPYLVHNSGFWMSYGCVFAVLILTPLVKTEKRYFSGKSLKDKAIGSFKISFCIMTGTMPILLWFYYEISFWGLLLNIIILPCMSLCLIVGMVSILLPDMFGILSRLPVLIVCFLIRFFKILCTVTEITGTGCITFGRPSPVQVIIWVLFWISILSVRKLRSRMNPKTFMAAALAASLILILPHDFTPRVTFLDVGQGDSIFIQNGNRNVYLIDGGSSSSYSIGKYVIGPFLKYNGIREIEGIFLTHPDADHCNGVIELLDNSQIRIKRVIIGANTYEVWNEKYPELFLKCDENNIDVCYIEKGSEIKDGNMDFYCLHPENDGSVSAENKDSEVLLLSAYGHSILFTGDLEGEGEEQTIEAIKELEGFLGVDVLKVAHHGSKNSTLAEFIDITDPKLAIISVGANNTYGHPSPATLDRLSSAGVNYLRTDISGAISIRLN